MNISQLKTNYIMIYNGIIVIIIFGDGMLFSLKKVNLHKDCHKQEICKNCKILKKNTIMSLKSKTWF